MRFPQSLDPGRPQFHRKAMSNWAQKLYISSRITILGHTEINSLTKGRAGVEEFRRRLSNIGLIGNGKHALRSSCLALNRST